MDFIDPVWLRDTDPATAALCLQLQLEDLDCVSSKGKEREDQQSDAQYARQLYLEELNHVSGCLSDRAMATSIATAVRSDGPSISTELVQADLIARDHVLARTMSIDRLTEPPSSASLTVSEILEDEMIEKLDALYMAEVDRTDLTDTSDLEENGTSSSTGPTPPARRRKRRPETRPCIICREHHRFFDLARVPCGHEYCRECLQQLLQASTNDESLYPPRCCHQPFKLSALRLFAPSESIKRVENKYLEFSTTNRTYCHLPECSTFVPPNNIANDVATCTNCGAQTCSICKGHTHEGDCPDDEGLRQALELAGQQGWQRCPNCWAGIELGEGCYHITCRCRHEFCYICGERWKTCTCEQWDRVRLRQRATRLIDRNAAARRQQPGPNAQPVLQLPGVAPPQPQHAFINAPETRQRANAVEEMMQNLEQNHDCQHPSWNWVRGPNQCEECFVTLPKYIFRCQQCQIQACNRCRRNRL